MAQRNQWLRTRMLAPILAVAVAAGIWAWWWQGGRYTTRAEPRDRPDKG
ncbi:MAG: hypothetical protein ACRD0C_18085 [Acidimicrobiia bacterium]